MVVVTLMVVMMVMGGGGAELAEGGEGGFGDEGGEGGGDGGGAGLELKVYVQSSSLLRPPTKSTLQGPQSTAPATNLPFKTSSSTKL